MAFTPMNDRLLVRRFEGESTSRGGIIIPDTAKEKPQRGTVVAAGPGKPLDNGERRTPVVSQGDQILFGKYAGDEVKLDGEKFLILREDEVLAIIEN